MKHTETPHQYCSLDLELTGFDPASEEILEVGFVFFTVGPEGIATTDSWSSLFRPSKPVSQKILGLTGITAQDIEQAPRFLEHRDELQRRLEHATLVGHSIGVDIRFLEAAGITLRGGSVDTLDLVQFLLPTHHSYNLENLMHYFGIAHTEAHRALGDAKATIKVLESLMARFHSFPPTLQEGIRTLIQGRDLLWEPFFTATPPKTPTPPHKETGIKSQKNSRNPLILPTEGHVILTTNDTLVQDTALIEAVRNLPGKKLLVLPRAHDTLDAWKTGGIDPLFPPEHRFDPLRFAALQHKPDLTADELRFTLKVLVWQATNWQTATVLDLNLSFFGNNFLSLITGGETQEALTGSYVVTDTATFAEMKAGETADYRVIIARMDEFERELARTLGSRVSWGKTLHILRGIYNPETNAGNLDHKEAVLEALAATDLFFGLMAILLHKKPGTKLVVAKPELDPYVYGKLERAANHYITKMRSWNKSFDSDRINSTLESLGRFLAQDADTVQWIEIGDEHTALCERPLTLAGKAQHLFHANDNALFITTVHDKHVNSYFARRLGAENFRHEHLTEAEPLQITTHITVQEPKQEDILRAVTTETLPIAVLFPSSKDIREFYDAHHTTLKQYGPIFALGYAGGTQKILKNFTISGRGILLATHEFIEQHFEHRLSIKNLIIIGLPTVETTHPYFRALERQYEAQDASLEQVMQTYAMHKILHAFISPSLARVQYYLPKGSVAAQSAVRAYLNAHPNIRIEPY